MSDSEASFAENDVSKQCFGSCANFPDRIMQLNKKELKVNFVAVLWADACKVFC